MLSGTKCCNEASLSGAQFRKETTCLVSRVKKRDLEQELNSCVEASTSSANGGRIQAVKQTTQDSQAIKLLLRPCHFLARVVVLHETEAYYPRPWHTGTSFKSRKHSELFDSSL